MSKKGDTQIIEAQIIEAQINEVSEETQLLLNQENTNVKNGRNIAAIIITLLVVSTICFMIATH